MRSGRVRARATAGQRFATRLSFRMGRDGIATLASVPRMALPMSGTKNGS
jgi:hypothetical protein